MQAHHQGAANHLIPGRTYRLLPRNGNENHPAQKFQYTYIGPVQENTGAGEPKHFYHFKRSNGLNEYIPFDMPGHVLRSFTQAGGRFSARRRNQRRCRKTRRSKL